MKFSDGPGNLVAERHVGQRAYLTIDRMSITRRAKSSSLTNLTGNEAELYVDADDSAQKNNPARDHAGRVFS